MWIITRLTLFYFFPALILSCKKSPTKGKTQVCGIRNIDCQIGNGVDYRGQVNVTKSGLACKNWDLDILRRHRVPWVSEGRHNLCRNPGGERSGVYCFADGYEGFWKWEYCPVRRCVDCDEEVITTTTSTTPRPKTDILFIGPGTNYYHRRFPEAYTLPSFTRADFCTPPMLQEFLDSHVGTLTPDGPLLCDTTCYILAKNGSWVVASVPGFRRGGAASVDISEGWWVTGGKRRSEALATTEVWNGTNWLIHDPLPRPMWGHCMVKINSTHVFLTIHQESYLYSKDTGFVRMQDMIRYRYEHTCGLHDNLVWAAGGLGNMAGTQESSEYFSLETLTWTEGPSITFKRGKGKYRTLGKIVTWGKRTYWIVSQNIWELVKSGESSRNSWEWVKVGETEYTKTGFQVFIISSDDCTSWE